jgi:hypothetical protein
LPAVAGYGCRPNGSAQPSARGGTYTTRPQPGGSTSGRHSRPMDTITALPTAPDTCSSGSCRYARPGTVCDCTDCDGRHHGEASDLPPLACGGVKVVGEPAPSGGYAWRRCRGCPDCRSTVVPAPAPRDGRDVFARLAVAGGLAVDDEPW